MKKGKSAYYNDVADVLKTLAHPERLAILELLYKNINSHLKVKDIYKKLDVSQPVASKHLGIMWRSGILKKHHRGTNTAYVICSDRAEIRRIVKFLFGKTM